MWNWIKQLDRILRGEATHMASLREGTIEIPAAGLCMVIFTLAITFPSLYVFNALVGSRLTRPVFKVDLAARICS